MEDVKRCKIRIRQPDISSELSFDFSRVISQASIMLVTSFSLLISVFAQTSPAAAPASTAQVPPVMYEFMGQFYRLQPFMFSPKGFADKKNDVSIREGLHSLSEISKRLDHSSRLSTAAFQVSADALQSHLREMSEAFSAGRKEYSRKLLVATLDGCSSCHTQVPGRALPGWTFRKEEIKGDDFERAEFLFAVRHYQEALNHYAVFIQKFNPKKDDAERLETALRRELVIYVRVLRDPASGIKTLEPHLKNKSLPKAIRSDLEGWIMGLKKLSKVPAPDPLKASAEEVERFTKKTLDPILKKTGVRFQPESFVGILAASGLIFDLVNNKPSALTPELLRRLALCDALISQGYYFSLTDNYLRECIVRFPTSPGAQLCFSDLESSLTAAYTGSAGTNIPQDVKDEITRFKIMLKK